MRLALIAALARNGAIGKDNALLWRLSEDLQHFKRTTLGCPVVMGRKTFESIGRPLPGRRNLVITRNPQWRHEGVEVAPSLPDALGAAADAPKVFVIGGAEIYAQALPLADELVLTEIDADFEGDAFFPAWDRGTFQNVEQTVHVSPHGWTYTITTYQRRMPASQ